ncbi:hypothetical protein [Chryseobacterium sp. JAH]|uniref:hypothetical protein n=1 Tax=Chryseobacterium sp. JAH TaxID=1742858 RepID=UPI000740EB0B|nr:hypothetical protein [Chryseobacterium sp. JAH]KUJ49944.1 hypothetical protein AR685_17125 [Chryseobacterium sp. JAH]
MRKLIILSAFIFTLVFLYLTEFPIIIDQNTYKGEARLQKLRKGEKFNFSEKLNIKIDENCKLVFIVNDRNDVADDYKFGKVFTTTNHSLINEFLTTEYTYTGADVATVQNEIYFYRNNQCVFKTLIISDGESEGLQSSDFGWIQPEKDKQFSKILNNFERNYSPIIVLK